MASGDQPKYTDVSAEQAVLSSIYNHGIESIIEVENFGIEPKDFFYETNSVIFSAMKDFFEEKPTGRIDKFAVISRIRDKCDERIASKIENNEEFFDALEQMNVGKDSVSSLAYSIRKNSVFRSVLDSFEEAKLDVENATDSNTSLEELLCLVENKCSRITDSITNPNAKFKKFGDGFSEWLEEIIDNPSPYVGIPTGYPIYDHCIGRGLRRGTVALVGARPGRGKSLWSLNIGVNVSKLNVPVLYLDTELVKESQNARLAARIANIGISETECGDFAKDPNKLKRARDGVKEIEKLPFYHEYVGKWHFEEIIAYMKKWVRQVVGVDENGNTNDCVIIFDYMKMMHDKGLANLKEYQVIGFWMTALHDFSVRYDVPILSLIQLNRDGIMDERQGVAAQSDRTEWIASSFSIIKDKTEDELAESGEFGNMKMIILKSRFGPETPGGDYINLRVDKRRALFEEGSLKSQENRNNDNNRQSRQEG